MKKNLLFLVIVIASCSSIFAQSQGPNSPAAATYSAIGCLSCPGAEWNNWNNILAADGMTADVSLNAFPNCFQTSCFYSRYLMASNFGFTIPSTATIEGIKAEIIRMSSSSPNVKDTIVQIFTSGNFGSNHADTSAWTPSPLTITYGDSLDAWGLSLTPDSVNNTGFGFRIMIRNGHPIVTFAPSSVDHIQITVYYTISTGTFSQTKSAGEYAIFPNPVFNELRIKNAGSRILDIEIFNLYGEKIYSRQTAVDKQALNISSLSPGIYLAVINTGTEKIAQKFVKTAR